MVSAFALPLTRPPAKPRRRRWLALASAVLAALGWAPGGVRAQDAPLSLIRDTEIEEILHQECDPVFIAAGLNPKDVTIHIVADKEINAFTPGGLDIFINTGLISETKTPNELIGVVAHETGHVAGGHVARSGEGEKSAMRTFLLTMGLGIAAAIAGAPDVAGALMGSSSYFATLDYLGFSRIQEAQADQAAATYLDKAGYSGKGLVDFFDHFRYEEVFSRAKQYPFFQSHPLTSDRIEALRVRVEKEPHYGATDTPEMIERHKIMVAKLKAYVNPPNQTFIDYKESNPSFEARYARAIAYYKATEPDKAIKGIDALIAEQPNNPYLYEVKGQVLFEGGRVKDSEAPYRKSVELKPDAPLLQVNLGQTLVAEDDPAKLDEAIAHLNRALDFEKDNAFAWQILARAYDSKGEAGMARLATAEQDFSLGQMRDAWTFAMRARELLPKNTPEWRRATDIVLVSRPDKDSVQSLSRDDGLVASER